MNINSTVKIFSQFLNNSFNIVHPLIVNRNYTTDEDSLNDWLQANWEILVERKVLPIGNYLQVYGDGADFNGESSRITDLNEVPTFVLKIKCIQGEILDLLNDEKVKQSDFVFDRLVGFVEGYYTLIPPFNCVMVQDEIIGKERVFHIENVDFVLVKI